MPLIVGQSTAIGTATTVWNGTSIAVAYNVTDLRWSIASAHVEVGASLAYMKLSKNGNPNPGQFDLKNGPGLTIAWPSPHLMEPMWIRWGHFSIRQVNFLRKN